jgi:CBS domain-containing protein
MARETLMRDIMARDVLTLDPDQSLREAVNALSGREVSGAPVVSGGKLVGVISTSDILEFVASTPPVPDVQPDQTEWGELELDEEQVQEDEGAPTFFTDLWSDVGADVLERFYEQGGPEWDLLAENTVESVMTRKPIVLPSDATVGSAARLLLDRGIHRVLIVDDGQLVGIVTSTDLLQTIANK